MPKTETKGRNNEPVYIMMPPDERARLVDFAAKVDRPLSWVIRDALRVYLDAVGTDAANLARLRAKVDAPKVDPKAAGKTKQPKPGPRAGFGTYIKPAGETL